MGLRRNVLTAMVFTGLAFAPAPYAFGEPFTIPGTEFRDIQPAAGGEPFRIFIAKPSAPPPEAGYPVIYLTDANAMFATLVDTLRIRTGGPSSAVEPAVVVGLGYPTDKPFDVERRAFDLTPDTGGKPMPERPNGKPWPKMGGADDFLAFIENEIKPLIASEVKIDTARETLVGHSFGGLFALHVLFTRPEAFDAYVAGSPSIWYGERHIDEEAKAFVGRIGKEPVNADLLLTVGELEQVSPAGTPDAEKRAAWVAGNRMLDNTRDMRERLTGLEDKGLRLVYREFPGEGHISVIPALISRAVPFAASRTN